MDADALVALVGSAVLGLVVRFFNLILEWLTGVLGVEPVEPIPSRAGRSPSAAPGEPTLGDPTPPGTDTAGDG